jgi:anti-anti-sigma regulatory factor
LVAFSKRVKEVDGKVALCALSDNIQDIFDTVGYTPFFDIHKSAKQALASLA